MIQDINFTIYYIMVKLKRKKSGQTNFNRQTNNSIKSKRQ